MLDALLAELTRPEREKGATPTFRHGTVTATQASPAAVQVDVTGDAWLRYLDGLTPAVGDVVVLVQQGTDAWVLGRFAA